MFPRALRLFQDFSDAAGNTHLQQRVLTEERCLQRGVSSTRAPSAAITPGGKERVFRAPGCLPKGLRVPRPFQQSRGSRNQKSDRDPHRKGRLRNSRCSKPQFAPTSETRRNGTPGCAWEPPGRLGVISNYRGAGRLEFSAKRRPKRTFSGRARSP